jgi:hypothetical protein
MSGVLVHVPVGGELDEACMAVNAQIDRDIAAKVDVIGAFVQHIAVAQLLSGEAPRPAFTVSNLGSVQVDGLVEAGGGLLCWPPINGVYCQAFGYGDRTALSVFGWPPEDSFGGIVNELQSHLRG